MVLDTAIVVLLIVIEAVFVATELALVSLRSGQINQLKERGQRGRALAALVEEPTGFLAAVQIA